MTRPRIRLTQTVIRRLAGVTITYPNGENPIPDVIFRWSNATPEGQRAAPDETLRLTPEQVVSLMRAINFSESGVLRWALQEFGVPPDVGVVEEPRTPPAPDPIPDPGGGG